MTEKQSTFQQIKDNFLTIAIGIILALFIRIFIAEPRYIPSESMFPTLTNGDRLVIEKVSYHFHQPHFQDIVVFKAPEQLQKLGYDENQALIKRIIGREGDTVAVENGKIYLNNVAIEENYILEQPYYNLAPVKVPSGFLFVMGDNRNNSNDSHIWGFLPENKIIGKAIFRFWPLERIGNLNYS